MGKCVRQATPNPSNAHVNFWSLGPELRPAGLLSVSSEASASGRPILVFTVKKTRWESTSLAGSAATRPHLYTRDCSRCMYLSYSSWVNSRSEYRALSYTVTSARANGASLLGMCGRSPITSPSRLCDESERSAFPPRPPREPERSLSESLCSPSAWCRPARSIFYGHCET
jgi:hypothetical protein